MGVRWSWVGVREGVLGGCPAELPGMTEQPKKANEKPSERAAEHGRPIKED